MTASRTTGILALAALLTSALASAAATDRPVDRDRLTGVVVAPGATTWSSENFEEKKGLITETAAAEGKTCTDYSFLGWAPGSGGTDVIMPATRKGFESAGYTVAQTQGHFPTDTIWTVAKEGREAVILWGAVAGSTIYLSCLTAGTAAEPGKTP